MTKPKQSPTPDTAQAPELPVIIPIEKGLAKWMEITNDETGEVTLHIDYSSGFYNAPGFLQCANDF